jgi:hypothetical protein
LDGIAKAVTRLGFVAVYITAHSAHFVPRRAFGSDALANELVARVRKHIDALKSTSLR